MSAELNKAVVHRMLEALNQKNPKMAEDIFAANWVNHDPAFPPLQGIEGARQLVSMFGNAFPDRRVVIENMIAEGDRVACNFTFSGTHQGEFNGIPPTGKHVQVNAAGVFRVVDGRLTDNWVNFDALGMLTQMGLIPAPQQ
jgi:steroid delta-isomerase-like uncharacterized protein